jgi:hypothetical protein
VSSENDTVTVYKVQFVGTADGTQSYDDNNFYDVGNEGYDFPEVYGSRKEADEACARLNRDFEQMSHDVGADEYEDTPFFKYESELEPEWGYEDRFTLPWELLWDKCLDLGIAPPAYDEDEAGNNVRPAEPPDSDEIREWWWDNVAHVPEAVNPYGYINGTWVRPTENPRKQELTDALMPFIKLPVLYQVVERQTSKASREGIIRSFAGDIGVTVGSKIAVSLHTADGTMVERFAGDAAKALVKVNEFLLMHGIGQKAAGRIDFGPFSGEEEEVDDVRV